MLGRCLGPTKHEGNEMTLWCLKENGRIVPRRTIFKLRHARGLPLMTRGNNNNFNKKKLKSMVASLIKQANTKKTADTQKEELASALTSLVLSVQAGSKPPPGKGHTKSASETTTLDSQSFIVRNWIAMSFLIA